MKSLLLFLTYCFIFALQAYAQNGSDKEFDNLIGPVQNLRVERALINSESGECVEGRRLRSTFDAYDIKGKLITTNRNRFDADNPEDRLRHYPFGDGPVVVARVNVAPFGTLTGTYIYSYNGPGRQSEWICLRPDGSTEQRVVFSFNFDGRLDEETTYDSDLQIDSRTTYSYDDRGNEVERTDIEKDGSIINVLSFQYEFDRTGNWVKKVMTRKRPNDGQMRVEAVAVYYRTITYY